MWELDCEESWMLKNWCFWSVVLEKTFEHPLDCKEFQPVHSKGDQSWVFFERTDAKAETPILWPPLAKSWLIWKDYDAGRDWGQEQKGTTEDAIVGRHHWLNGRDSKWTPGDGVGRGGLACCDLWGHKESDTTEWLNWTEILPLIYMVRMFNNLCMSICFSYLVSRSAVSYSLQTHESQHARLPSLSPTPGVHSHSWPSSQWCHPVISSSVVLFFSCPQSLPAWVFPTSQLFALSGQSTGVSALASFLPKKSQGWSPS